MKDPAKKYTVSEGEILAAAEADEVIGIIAYHKHSKVHCEMKRFYSEIGTQWKETWRTAH